MAIMEATNDGMLRPSLMVSFNLPHPA